MIILLTIKTAMKLSQLKWKPHLDPKELVAYALKTSPFDEDEEALEEYFGGASADLKEVDVSWVKRKRGMDLRGEEGDYADMPASTAPPIIVNSDGLIEDGQHRYEAAKKRGDKTR